MAALSFVPNQTSDGLRFVMVTGDFGFGDDLTRFTELVKSHNPSVVSFDSPGGNPHKAMQLGRLIRSLGLHTVQFRAADCSSACSLAFLGGVTRYSEPGAIGVHKSSFRGDFPLDAHEAVSAVQQTTAEVMTYMIEMGADPALLQLSLQYESNDIRYLSMSEMTKYRVVTASWGANSPSFQPTPTSPSPQFPPSLAPSIPPNSPVARVEPPAENSPLVAPQASTGRIRHPRGVVPLKALPEGTSATLSDLRNGIPVTIIGAFERWYRVRAGSQTGYLHDTWVYVDQFDIGPFDHRHIQVKSFDNLAQAEAYVRSSSIPLAAYRATNGWFAVTLRSTYPHSTAKILVESMKQSGTIPDDSYVTYGNTYASKVCCE